MLHQKGFQQSWLRLNCYVALAYAPLHTQSRLQMCQPFKDNIQNYRVTFKYSVSGDLHTLLIMFDNLLGIDLNRLLLLLQVTMKDKPRYICKYTLPTYFTAPRILKKARNEYYHYMQYGIGFSYVYGALIFLTQFIAKLICLT